MLFSSLYTTLMPAALDTSSYVARDKFFSIYRDAGAYAVVLPTRCFCDEYANTV